jgi:tRNA1(Val) A37 N6-methylase TrmN6
LLSVVGSSDKDGILDLCQAVSVLGSLCKFDTSKSIVSSLEADESYIAYSFCNGTVSAILPTG